MQDFLRLFVSCLTLDKLKHLQEELETEKKDKRDSHGSKNTRSDSFSSRQSARTRGNAVSLILARSCVVFAYVKLVVSVLETIVLPSWNGILLFDIIHVIHYIALL